jgi:hypothetical protein
MSYDNEENYDNAVDYLNKNYTINDYMSNEEIMTMHDIEHYTIYTIRFRKFIEDLNKKYIDLYNYSGLFQDDMNNSTWERVFDIVYNNISVKFDINFIYNNAEEIIDILEK